MRLSKGCQGICQKEQIFPPDNASPSLELTRMLRIYSKRAVQMLTEMLKILFCSKVSLAFPLLGYFCYKKKLKYRQNSKMANKGTSFWNLN